MLGPCGLRRVAAGGEFLDGFGGQWRAANAPFAARYFPNLYPGHAAHVLTLDRDHGIGQFLDDLVLLLGAEHLFNQMHFDQWHCTSSILASPEARIMAPVCTPSPVKTFRKL